MLSSMTWRTCRLTCSGTVYRWKYCNGIEGHRIVTGPVCGRHSIRLVAMDSLSISKCIAILKASLKGVLELDFESVIRCLPGRFVKSGCAHRPGPGGSPNGHGAPCCSSTKTRISQAQS